MKFLGIDYGTKRIGIAVSSGNNILAFPRSVLPNTKNLINAIKTILKKEDIGGIVVGESRNFKGDPNPLMKDIEIFIEMLNREFNIPIYLEPEFLTSHQAQQIQGKNKMLDASAAAIILQSFLDKKDKQ